MTYSKCVSVTISELKHCYEATVRGYDTKHCQQFETGDIIAWNSCLCSHNTEENSGLHRQQQVHMQHTMDDNTFRGINA